MKILLDTNILIDYISQRPSFVEDAQTILRLCSEKQVEGCIAAHSIMNAFYILRKALSLEERRETLSNLCCLLTVVGIDKIKIISALGNEKFSDVEDCLQMECAIDFSADYIVTRNVKDFSNSKIPAILPGEFLKKINK